MANQCCVSSETPNLSKELKSMEKEIPLPYNDNLAEILKTRSSKPVTTVFLQYEPYLDSALTERDMPLELKYLPLSLSGMRTNYRQGDRCGYWALPSLVAMRYGLTVDENLDERSDIHASTEAALDYISDLHKNYNDWWYAILAYCNSPSTLNQVLVHAGSNPSLWDFYEKKLMPDAHVIADFIAYVYLANEDSLTYSAVVDYEETTVAETPTDNAGKANDKNDASIRKYKIRKGDTLTKIAAMFHVSISDLMEWNNLTDDKILEGQTLIIKK